MRSCHRTSRPPPPDHSPTTASVVEQALSLPKWRELLPDMPTPSAHKLSLAGHMAICKNTELPLLAPPILQQADLHSLSTQCAVCLRTVDCLPLEAGPHCPVWYHSPHRMGLPWSPQGAVGILPNAPLLEAATLLSGLPSFSRTVA